MDVPAPYAGVIESLLVAVGDKVKTGSAIAKIMAEAPAATQEPAKPDAMEAVESLRLSLSLKLLRAHQRRHKNRIRRFMRARQ